MDDLRKQIGRAIKDNVTFDETVNAIEGILYWECKSAYDEGRLHGWMDGYCDALEDFEDGYY